MALSQKTLACLANLMANVLSHSDLEPLVYQFGVEESTPKGNRQNRAIHLLKRLVQHPGKEFENPVVDIIQYIQKFLPNAPESTWKYYTDYQAFLSSLRLDGFEIDAGKVIPTTPAPAALAPELSVLEKELKQCGFGTAQAHYAQAVDNFLKGNWEACNGQVRPFVEDTIISIGERLTTKTRKDPKASLQDLLDRHFLDQEEVSLIKSFWSGIHDNGPHRGLSSEQEALFRLHVSTAITRYLIFKLTACTPKTFE